MNTKATKEMHISITDDLKKRIKLSFLPLLFGVAISITGCNVLADARIDSVKQTAKAVTVRIITLNYSGSGVIIQKQGNLYTLVTNKHVVCGKNRPQCTDVLPNEKYIISTPDGGQHEVKAQTVKILSNDLDLVIMQFNSARNYTVAQIADSDTLKAGDAVYIAGFPVDKVGGFAFTTGEVLAAVSKRIEGDFGGYTIIYNAPTQPGMSGGGVFNDQGKIIGIHGVGDIVRRGTLDEGRDHYDASYLIDKKIGLFNRGVPINRLVERTKIFGINLDVSTSFERTEVTKVGTFATADEYFIAGVNRFIEPGRDIKIGKQSVIVLLSKAINLNSKYSFAYFVRGLTYEQLHQYQLALNDYNQAISLNPKYQETYKSRGTLKAQMNDVREGLADINQAIALNPKDIEAYTIRGNLKSDILNGRLNTDILTRMLTNAQDALADYNQAITLAPEDPRLYYNRGIVKGTLLNDGRGALVDFNQAIDRDPKYVYAYYNRGLLKDQLHDIQGALADYNQAIALAPQDTESYNNRGILKADQLNDRKGALADFNQAIALNPHNLESYYNRGALKMKLNDGRGALADFNQVIALNPQSPQSYINRGILKEKKLHDKAGAIADFRQAARIARKQPTSSVRLQSAITELHRLGATE